ncbi:hypothetical protein TNCV_2383641 [Trichonephila clavipes]|nr:hypothetical protein TNCV_2383641 [Trichonephila clavipes]
MNSSPSNHQIQDAAGHHILRGNRRNDCITFWRDNNIEELIHERYQPDLSAAFDGVWRHKLINTIHATGISSKRSHLDKRFP